MMKWFLFTLLIVAGGAGLNELDKRFVPPLQIASTPRTCGPLQGDKIHLCRVTWQDDGLIWVFEKPVSSLYVAMFGPDAEVRYWVDRDDIGNMDLAFSWRQDNSEELWGTGIFNDPPIVAIWTAKRVFALEDVCYH